MTATPKQKTKFQKNILAILQCREEWSKIVIEGKPLVQEILAETKNSEEDKGCVENLQYLCGQLKDVTNKFHPLLSELEQLIQKIHSSFCFANFSASFNDSLNLESSSSVKLCFTASLQSSLYSIYGYRHFLMFLMPRTS